MTTSQKTKKQLIDELAAQKQRIDALERETQELRKVKGHTHCENEATLKSIFRAAPIGIGMVNNRVITHVNDKLCKMTGYEADDLIGNSARILYPTNEEFEYVGQEKYAQIAKSETGMVTTRWLRKDGRIINVILSSAPIDPKDHAVGVTFTALDITAHKHAEQELRINRNYLETLNNALGDVIITLKWPERVIEYTNLSVQEMFGYVPDECTGLPAAMFYVDNEEYEKIGKLVTSHLENGKKVVRFETYLKRKNGVIFPAHVTTTFMKEKMTSGKSSPLFRISPSAGKQKNGSGRARKCSGNWQKPFTRYSGWSHQTGNGYIISVLLMKRFGEDHVRGFINSPWFGWKVSLQRIVLM
jgi:PAS domain S-box-containing protein